MRYAIQVATATERTTYYTEKKDRKDETNNSTSKNRNSKIENKSHIQEGRERKKSGQQLLSFNNLNVDDALRTCTKPILCRKKGAGVRCYVGPALSTLLTLGHGRNLQYLVPGTHFPPQLVGEFFYPLIRAEHWGTSKVQSLGEHARTHAATNGRPAIPAQSAFEKFIYFLLKF